MDDMIPHDRSSGGRDQMCTPKRTQHVARLLRAGNWITTCCAAAGITRTSFYNWLERGESELIRVEQGDPPHEQEKAYMDFYVAVMRARAEAEIESVARVRLAGKGRSKSPDEERDWKADAWWLERAHPDRWGRRNLEIDQKVESKAEHKISLKNLSDGALDELINVLEGETEGDDGYEGGED